MLHGSKIVKRRKLRNRLKIKRAIGDRHRLSIFRSGKHIYAQIIDDKKGITLVSASTLEKKQRKNLDTGSNVLAATVIGKLIAERAIANGVGSVTFDRGHFKYHGRVKALAEAARESGLRF